MKDFANQPISWSYQVSRNKGKQSRWQWDEKHLGMLEFMMYKPRSFCGSHPDAPSYKTIMQELINW